MGDAVVGVGTLKVRAARSDDRDGVLGLRCALWPDRDPQEHRRAIDVRIDSPLQHGLLVLEDARARLSGFVEVSREPATPGRSAGARVQGLFVAPGARGNGGARLLVDAAGRWAHGRGAATLAFEIDVDSDAAAVVERLGFATVRRTVRLERRVSAPLEITAPGPRTPALVAPASAATVAPVYLPPAAPAPSRRLPVLVANLLLLAAAVASFLATDIFSRDPVRGLLLPLLDVGFVIYFMVLFAMMRYRKRADSSARAAELFRHED